MSFIELKVASFFSNQRFLFGFIKCDKVKQNEYNVLFCADLIKKKLVAQNHCKNCLWHAETNFCEFESLHMLNNIKAKWRYHFNVHNMERLKDSNFCSANTY